MTIRFLASQRASSATSSPRLTIGIPTWNRSDRLRRQLDALVLHLSEDVEVLVCDNGSDDATWDTLQWFVDTNAFRLRCVRNACNLGADVNYLRVIEGAAGDWLWFVGDDDSFEFNVIHKLLSRLQSVESDLVMLLDTSEVLDEFSSTVDWYSARAFFEPCRDLFGQLLHQVGRMVCKVLPAQAHLRNAYLRGIGDLHAYAWVYAPLLMERGVTVLSQHLLADPQTEASPRWNLLKGHLGAWRSSITAFPSFFFEARARERRVRTITLLACVIAQLAQGHRLARQDRQWMFAAFDLKGKALLTGIVGAFAVNRQLAMVLLATVRPGLAAQLRHGHLAAHEPGY